MHDILQLLQHYHYLVLFPMAVFGGVVVAVCAGVLVAMQQFNFAIVFLILIVGDAIGDSLFYLLGRSGNGLLNKYGNKIGISSENINQAHQLFETHHRKAIYASKLAMAIGLAGLIVAGCLRINYWKFLLDCLTITFFRSLLLLIIGYYFGNAYHKIENALNVYVAIIALLIGIALVVFLLKYFKKTHLS
jgi:membrane protein DedA with SNARE-associated domain